MTVRIGFKTSPQNVDWATLDATWRRAGELADEPSGGFDSGWLNDHLTNTDPDVPGPSLEALTLLGTLIHHVPGLLVGHGVLSNTFRHPVLLAKAAVVLDHATGGRFVLGLGAGWFEGEHGPFGIDLPPIGPRIDRLVSAVDTLRALFSAEAAEPPGVTRADPFYPLAGAVNAPPPYTPGGPRLYLGGQRTRGIRLAARTASGWLQPGVNAGDVGYFGGKRVEIFAALEAEGRDPALFDFAGQVSTGRSAAERRAAVEAAVGMVGTGATHIILGMPAALGPAGLDEIARECLAPLRERFG
ncbi:MAG TPA: LLM class flavin-dependent oxidoreductase [Candidatus Limnocylindrales bacterium]|jgi:alkanesulfonate monooxygenase SsuD/methylene tetrahydromethanopterin reductase-like flavin-dependent oxidoreductase (luciferase family)